RARSAPRRGRRPGVVASGAAGSPAWRDPALAAAIRREAIADAACRLEPGTVWGFGVGEWPLGVDVGGEAVSGHVEVDVGDDELAGRGHRLVIQLGTTADPGGLLADHGQCLLEACRALGALREEVLAAGQDDVAPVRQRAEGA